MIVTEEVIAAVDRDLPASMSSLHGWFSLNENIFSGWAQEKGRELANLENYTMIPQLHEMLASRMMGCIMIGYLVSSVANSLQYTKEIGVRNFRSSFDGDPTAVYDVWLKGKLDDEYYSDTDIGKRLKEGFPEDYKIAVEAHAKLREKQTKVSIGKEIVETPSSAEKKKKAVKVKEDGVVL